MNFNLSSGQESSVWFEIGATWHYGYGEGAGTHTAGYEKLEVTGDTIINSIEYRTINRIRVFSNETIQVLENMYLRHDQENDQVYRHLDSTEYLLYDFSAEKGDTITVKIIDWEEISYSHLVVDSIRVEVFSDSIQRRVQYCHQINNFQFYFGGKRIEGIGSDMFLLPVNGLACDAGCARHFRCYQDSKVVITNPNIGCEELVTSSYQEYSYLDKIKLYPNPTKGFLYIENQSIFEVDRFELLDLTGRISIYSATVEYIDLEMFKAGIYIFKAVISDQSVVVKKIIKN